MEHLYKTVMDKSGYAEFIHRKIPSISIDDAVQFFVPTPKKDCVQDMNVNEFVTFIQNKLKERDPVVKIYNARTRERDIAASKNVPVQSEIHHSRPDISVQPHPDDLLNPPNRLVVGNFSSARPNVVNLRDNLSGASVSSSSSSSSNTNNLNNSRSVNPAIRNFFLGSDASDNQSVVSALSAGN
jgi:hypothetical protein